MFFPNLRSKQINFIKQKSRNENGNTWLIISQIYSKPTSTTNEFRSSYLLFLRQVSQLVLEPLLVCFWWNHQAPSALYPIP